MSNKFPEMEMVLAMQKYLAIERGSPELFRGSKNADVHF